MIDLIGNRTNELLIDENSSNFHTGNQLEKTRKYRNFLENQVIWNGGGGTGENVATV